MMRWLLCLLWLFCSGGAMAAALPLTLPSNVAASGTSYVTSGAATFSGAAFNNGLTTQVAGKAVTVPATWRLASNAGQVAISAIRLNPAGLVTSAIASWLIGYGLQWLNGQWVEPNPNNHIALSGGGLTCAALKSGGYNPGTTFDYTRSDGKFVYRFVLDGTTVPGGYVTVEHCTNYATNPQTGGFPHLYGYPVSSFPAPGDPVPATDASWAKVQADPVPDWVHSWLANKGIGLPLNPQLDPTPLVVPLSDPYLDPVTGKRYKDVAYITPSATNPKTADLQVGKQEVDANGNPVTDPNTGQPKAPEETDDPCLAHPERIGCMEKGEIPQAPDLAASEKTITITPDSGWGADTAACPADLTSTLRQGGVAVSFSFKPVCDGADMFRPVVIGMAWIAAVLIALGVGRKGD